MLGSCSSKFLISSRLRVQNIDMNCSNTKMLTNIRLRNFKRNFADNKENNLDTPNPSTTSTEKEDPYKLLQIDVSKLKQRHSLCSQQDQ